MYGSLFENDQKGKCALCGQEMGWKSMSYGDVFVCFDHSEHELRKIQVNTEHYHTLVLRGYELEKQLRIKTEAVDLEKKLSRLEFLIGNNQNEIERIVSAELRSFETKNTTNMVNLQAEIGILNSELGKIKQSVESNQAVTISEISEINETVAKQSETANTKLGELKITIQNSNTRADVDRINKIIIELNEKFDLAWDTIEHTKAELTTMAESIKNKEVPRQETTEPIKEHVDVPKELEKTIITEPSPSVPARIANPIQVEAYKIIQKSPCKGEEITANIGGDSKQKQKIRDALKILRKNGHVILEDGIYRLPT